MILLSMPNGAEPQNSSLAKHLFRTAWSAITTHVMPPIDMEYTLPYFLHRGGLNYTTFT